MVDITEYNAQLAQRRAQLEANRANIEGTQFTKPTVPQRLLRTLTPAGQMKLRQQFGKAKGEFEQKKQTALGELQGGFAEQEQLESEFQPYKEAYEDQQAYNRAVKLYEGDVPYQFVEGKEGRYLEKLYKTYGAFTTPQEYNKLVAYNPKTVTEVKTFAVDNKSKVIKPKDLGVRPVNINVMGDTKKVANVSGAPKFNITGFSILPLASAANESNLVNTKTISTKKFNLPKINISAFKPASNVSSPKLNNKALKSLSNIKWY